MTTILHARSTRLIAAAAALALATGALVAAPSAADARVVFRVGVGVPFYPAYYPPPSYYYPPPAYYYPPPPVVYAPPPVAAPPVAANPASAPYIAPNGQTCREYQTTMMINGAPQPTYGTACLQPDGTWRIVN